MLRTHVEHEPETAVFRNLVFKWHHPDINSHAPDVAVIPHVRERNASRGHFLVAAQETRRSLVIEIVSRSSRQDDRVPKEQDYKHVGIQEYVYVDIRPPAQPIDRRSYRLSLTEATLYATVTR